MMEAHMEPPPAQRNRIIQTPNTKEREAIFILCDTCYWSATYFTNSR